MSTTTLTADGMTYHVTMLDASSQFPQWKREIKSISQQYGVWALILGEEEAKLLPCQDHPATKFACDHCLNCETRRKTRMAINFLSQSISPQLRQKVLKFNDPSEIYKYLQICFFDPDHENSIRIEQWDIGLYRNLKRPTGSNDKDQLRRVVYAVLDKTEIGSSYTNTKQVLDLVAWVPAVYRGFALDSIDEGEDVPNFITLTAALQRDHSFLD